MTQADLDFFQSIVNQILRYVTKAEIKNEDDEKRASERRAQFKIIIPEVISEGQKTVGISYKTGEDDLKRLKYGQGSICRKTRIRKKDNSVYVIYEGRFYDETGKIKSIYAKTWQECARLLKAAQGNKKKESRRIYPTLSEWTLEWYNSFKVNSVKPSTRRSYEGCIKAINTALGKIKLNALKGEVLQKYFNGISAGNIRKKIYNLLNACLEKAVVLKKMSENPCRAVDLPKYKKIRRRAFSYEEQEKIYSLAPKKVAQAFFFLCATGLRIGEFLALTKEDFFFEEHFFKVDKSITAGIEGEPKTESSNRIVYYTDELLKNFDVESLGTYTYEGLRVSLARFMKANDISGVSLHSTRHTFSTICHSLGMNDKVLQTLMGHSTLAMTQDTYTHLLKKGTSKIYYYLQNLCAFIRTTT